MNNINVKERNMLIEEFSKLPVEFFSRMRHFQPQIGCLNCCGICSKFASKNSDYWSKEQLDNILYALKEVASKYTNTEPYLVWDRNEHRPGVVFSYLDNDIGTYPYLDYYLEKTYEFLGVKTRISTVGFSRHNERLNNLHKKINDNLLDTLGGVRLSFTPYAIGWQNNETFSKEDYALDMANFLKIYKKYYDHIGSGNRKMCVEIRYKPLCKSANVEIFNILERYVIKCGQYLFISKDRNIEFKVSQVSDPYDHQIKIDNEPLFFDKYYLKSNLDNNDICKLIANESFDDAILLRKNCRTYMFENREGIYYTFDPHIYEDGCYGIQIYPNTEKRKKSGYLISERYFLNVLLESYQNVDLNSVNWDNIDNVLSKLKDQAEIYINKGIDEIGDYILNEVYDTVKWYVFALKEAGYPPKLIYDYNFTIDTGIICNLGRGYNEFKAVTSVANEPLTPTHERNYGNKISTMTKEGTVWRLSCGFNNKIILEELDLSKTATKEGQTTFYKEIESCVENEKVRYSAIHTQSLIPGQRGKA